MFPHSFYTGPRKWPFLYFVMEARYEIVLQIKHVNQLVPYGTFQLGYDKCFAVNLFISLRGSPNRRADSVINAALVKRVQDKIEVLANIHCSYLQLGDNMKTITRELFKQLNLNERNMVSLNLQPEFQTSFS